MTTLSTAEARDQLSDVINRAAFGKERIVLTRRGKALVAVVPIEDLRAIEEAEDREEVEDFYAGVEYARLHGSIPLSQVKAELGIE